MRKPFFILFICMLAVSSAKAQSTYTEHLTDSTTGSGRVVIVQDSVLHDLVNNTGKYANINVATGGRGVNSGHGKSRNSRTAGTVGTRTRHKEQGYRVLVFTGNNTREGRLGAEKMQRKAKATFAELSAYVQLRNSRWVCLIGDFRKREDAENYMRRCMSSGLSNEVRIIRSEVSVPD